MNTPILVECPLCHSQISRLLVELNGKFAWGFCSECKGELTEEQVRELNKHYEELRSSKQDGEMRCLEQE